MSSVSTKPARGMRDVLPADVRRRAYVIGVITNVYEQYGFEPLETPAVENLETLMGKYGEEGNQLIFRIMKRGEELDKSLDSVREQAFAGLKRAFEQEHGGPPVVLDPLWAAARAGLKRAAAPVDPADLALRYDLTVPLARVVAEYRASLPKFFKRYQIQPVWRADRPARGRFREFYQCDVDILGSRAMVVEAELCAAVSDVLSRLGFANFVIRINHRQVLNGILDAAGVPASLAGDALVALDKLDKIGHDGVQTELQQRGISPDSGAKLLALFEQVAAAGTDAASGTAAAPAPAAAGADSAAGFDSAAGADAVARTGGAAVATSAANAIGGGGVGPGENREPLNARLLAQLSGFVGEHAAAQRGISELREVLDLAASTPAAGRIRIDPSLARGLSYYTGAIMEINVPDLAGSLGGGGRYDNLVGMFLGQDVPACGFSLGLERIIVVMTERGMFPAGLDGAPADVMVTLWPGAPIASALALAHELRAAGIRVDVYPEPDKIGKQFKYASSRGIRQVAVLGGDEIAAGTVAIKDMQSGEQRTVPRRAAARAIKPEATPEG
jgi:histidyl-tRNA synthetase